MTLGLTECRLSIFAFDLSTDFPVSELLSIAPLCERCEVSSEAPLLRLFLCEIQVQCVQCAVGSAQAWHISARKQVCLMEDAWNRWQRSSVKSLSFERHYIDSNLIS